MIGFEGYFLTNFNFLIRERVRIFLMRNILSLFPQLSVSNINQEIIDLLFFAFESELKTTQGTSILNLYEMAAFSVKNIHVQEVAGKKTIYKFNPKNSKAKNIKDILLDKKQSLKNIFQEEIIKIGEIVKRNLDIDEKVKIFNDEVKEKSAKEIIINVLKSELLINQEEFEKFKLAKEIFNSLPKELNSFVTKTHLNNLTDKKLLVLSSILWTEIPEKDLKALNSNQLEKYSSKLKKLSKFSNLNLNSDVNGSYAAREFLCVYAVDVPPISLSVLDITNTFKDGAQVTSAAGAKFELVAFTKILSEDYKKFVIQPSQQIPVHVNDIKKMITTNPDREWLFVDSDYIKQNPDIQTASLNKPENKDLFFNEDFYDKNFFFIIYDKIPQEANPPSLIDLSKQKMPGFVKTAEFSQIAPNTSLQGELFDQINWIGNITKQNDSVKLIESNFIAELSIYNEKIDFLLLTIMKTLLST